MKRQFYKIVSFFVLVYTVAAAPNLLFAGGVYTEQIITPYSIDPYDRFGFNVSISNDYALVSAEGDFDSSGAVYVYRRSRHGWIKKTKLTASEKSDGDFFGASVSISNRYAIIGALGSDSAYIFNRHHGSWIQMAKLTAGDETEVVRFGFPVSITNRFAIVGAIEENRVAFIFERKGDSWIKKDKLVIPDNGLISSVSITNNYVIIGSSYSVNSSIHAGAAYLFERKGDLWTGTTKLMPSDSSSYDSFGTSVSASGNYVIVGSSLKDDENGEDSGAAYIFKRSKHHGGAWIQVAKLAPRDRKPFDAFGRSVAIEGDYAIVGSPQSDEAAIGTGSVYVFKNKKHGGDSWIKVAKLIPSDGIEDDDFGISVSGSGNSIIVGGHSLAAYIYEKDHCKRKECQRNCSTKDIR
jgi:hypothetical protein